MSSISEVSANIMQLLGTFMQQELGNRLSEFAMKALIMVIEQELKKLEPISEDINVEN